MNNRSINPVIFTFSLFILVPLTAQAHHAYRAVYDFSKTETLEGQVVKLELVNPHARIFITVTGEDGEVEEWMIEGPGKLSLGRRGWTDDMFVESEAITVIGNPSFEGHRAIWFEKITLSDGTDIIDPLIADQLAIEEERRERARRAR
jgi:hypothetical protein